jgi:ribose 1,5-bisphosphate isomerase
MSFSQAVRSIQSLKVQGAEGVAKAALKALHDFVHEHRANSKLQLLRGLANAKRLLEEARPTEPCLRNALDYVVKKSAGRDERQLRESLYLNIQNAKKYLDQAERCIASIGSKKIRKNAIVFTHCHSTTVMDILKRAKSEHKGFEVHNTETRPFYQGRMTARELASHNIKVRYYVDAAARLAIKKADIMLIGCDAIMSDGRIVNKIGSEMFAEIAHRHDIPLYVCTSSWKFDPNSVFGFEEPLEERAAKEVWKNPPKGVVIDNCIFEIVNPDLVTGVITELGIFKPPVLIEELEHRNPWMFFGGSRRKAA